MAVADLRFRRRLAARAWPQRANARGGQNPLSLSPAGPHATGGPWPYFRNRRCGTATHTARLPFSSLVGGRMPQTIQNTFAELSMNERLEALRRRIEHEDNLINQ